MEKEKWKLVLPGKNSQQYEKGEETLTLISTGQEDLYHIIIEDNIVPTDINPLMFIPKEKVIEILNFDPWI